MNKKLAKRILETLKPGGVWSNGFDSWTYEELKGIADGNV